MQKEIVKLATSPAEIEKVFDIRKKVFCEEQNVPGEIEYDKYDKAGNVEHVILLEDEKVIGCARIRPIEDKLCWFRLAVGTMMYKR